MKISVEETEQMPAETVRKKEADKQSGRMYFSWNNFLESS
jgi:hypothetical protein